MIFTTIVYLQKYMFVFQYNKSFDFSIPSTIFVYKINYKQIFSKQQIKGILISLIKYAEKH